MSMTRRPLIALLAAALAFSPMAPALAQRTRAAAALPLASSPEQVGFSSERLKRLDAAMAKAVADGEVVGMTTLLARHGRVVAFNTYGQAGAGRPMTRDTIFRIYSMTKPVTGVAMMILFEEGKWRLDDPVTKFVPELRDLKVFEGMGPDGAPRVVNARRAPTMREVMSHTAGFGYGLSEATYVDRQFREKGVLTSATSKELIDRTAQIPLLFQPGEAWSYSVAVDIQGAIIERISGMSLGEFMRQRIFAPLGMNDTSFFVPAEKAGRLAAVYAYDPAARRLNEARTLFGMPMPDYTVKPDLESGGGGLVSTTMDYARFCQMLANGGELGGVRILSPASVKLMGTNVIPKSVLLNTDGRANLVRFNEAVGFGLDFMVLTDAAASGSLEGDGTMSWGGAAGTWFWVDPTNDVIFVGMIQRMAAGPNTVDLGATSRTLVYQALVDPGR